MDYSNIDIVVIGGGVAGFAAAISVAEENKNVLLIEKNNQLGGNATQANVGTICGAFFKGFNDQPKMVGHPYTKSFVTQVGEQSRTKPLTLENGLIVLPYEWSALQNIIASALQSNHIPVLNNTDVVSLEQENTFITAIHALHDNQKIQLKPTAVIDCSGNGIVSQLLGIEMLREEHYQAASQIFRIENTFAPSEYQLNMAIKRSMARLVNEKQWPESYQSLSVVPGSLRNGFVDLKLTLPDVITDNIVSNEMIKREALKRIEEFFPLLKSSIGYFSDASLQNIFPQLGIRVLNRSKGKYILTEQDVLAGKKFKDGVAIGTWPIEEWGYDGKVSLQFCSSDHGYDIPATCLMSPAFRNLYFGGKNISATSGAIASARVIGTSMQTGYAAGKIASARPGVEQKQAIQKLHQELSKNRI